VETTSTTGVGIANLHQAIVAASRRPRDPVAKAQRAIARAATALVRARVREALVEEAYGCELINAVIAGHMPPADAAYVILINEVP
jgi:hypothetical protein